MDFIEKRKKRKDRQIKTRMNRSLSKMLASFSVTAVVATSAVSLIQNIPSAEFINLEAHGNSMYYEVEIIDSSNIIVDETLTITISSFNDEQVQPLYIGQNSGYFEGLKYDTNYNIEVKANYGFGIGTLKSASKRTSLYYVEPSTASFQNIEVLGTQLQYDIVIQQPMNPHDTTTFVLRATSSSDSFTSSLLGGSNIGILDELSPNSEYVLTIESNQNGTITILDTDTITTGNYYAASLEQPVQTNKTNLGYENESYWLYTYQIEANYVDKQSEITTIDFRWASVYWQNLTSEGTLPEGYNVSYTTLPINENNQLFTLENLDGGMRVWSEIVALVGNETIILDTIIFDTPPSLNAMLYVQNVGPHFVVLDGYFSTLDFQYYDISYTLDLMQNSQIIRTFDLNQENFTIISDGQYSEATIEIMLNNLQAASRYHVRLTAHYQEKLTLESISEVINVYDIYTPSEYMVSTNYLRLYHQIEVTINVNDISNVFVDYPDLGYEAYFSYYVTTGIDYTDYVTSGSIGITSNMTSANIIIDIMSNPEANYRITLYSDIYAGNETDGIYIYNSMEIFTLDSLYIIQNPGTN